MGDDVPPGLGEEKQAAQPMALSVHVLKGGTEGPGQAGAAIGASWNRDAAAPEPGTT